MKSPLVKTILKANQALLVDGKLDSIPDYFAEDYTVHITGRNLKGGHKVVREIVEQLRHSFPDIQVDTEILLEGDSRIAWQRILRGTLENAYKGFPGSGKQLVWRDMMVSQFRDGRIAEEWVLTDLAEQLLLSRKR